ncbi:MAG: translation initiation factor IF-2 [Syntrophales bacterium]|jgi:translation initiation factor IF-2|nr:translation initiation factor IF-2 [Syntrophales bacterium]
MSKKRVYELAKELGMENKDLIAKLERIGIAVKSHSSTLEEHDIERILQELKAGEPAGMEEKRIKSTVIRRRAVRPAVEEVPAVPETPPAEPVAEKAKEAPVKEAPQKEAAPAAVPKKKTAKEEAAPAPVREQAEAPVAEKELRKKKEEPAETVAKAPQEAEAPAPKPAPPADVKKHAPPREAPPAAAAPAEPKPPVEPKAPPRAPERMIVSAPPASGAERAQRAEAEKPKKKGKKPVEVLMAEPVPVRKKSFIKKIADRRDKREDADHDERPSRWREEKKTAVLRMKKPVITVPKAIKRRVKVGEAITVGDFAKKMGVKASEVINKLIVLGVMVGINQSIDRETATLVAGEFGYQIEPLAEGYDESLLRVETPSTNLKPRAPVVTIMGHVDHGKTSLLDAIRQTNVMEGEAGGITQAIGAYHVRIKDRDIVFLDTPGHEAFTAMRARGAQVTDIVVLVVAADDGVMGQTVEAINHAREAEVPMIVAINKIDKPGADSGKVKQALTEYGLVSEEWGGETIFCEVSAKKKVGIEELLEMILLQADIMELKADADRPARGVIIEAKLDKGRGPVATVLIQEGTLKEGDAFVAKTDSGRVRAMVDDQGRRVREAGPSMPVEVIGFSSVPQASTEFICVEDEKKARNISEYWIRKEREKELAATSKITLEQLYDRIKEGFKEFGVVLKADVQGSLEALTDALNKLSTSDVKLKIIHSSTGAITETDVMLASASNAIIIGFNVRPDSRVVEIAQQEGVEVKLYDIIYNAISDVRAAMEGLLEPEWKEVVLGRAEVREVFRVPKVGAIAGSYVSDGKIAKSASVKLVRDGVVVYDGKIASLRRFKDDAREVAAGLECGVGVEGFNDFKVGDVLEAYLKEKVARKLEDRKD